MAQSSNSDNGPYVRSIGDDETISEAVILAVSEVTGREPAPNYPGELEELDEFTNSINPDALDTLFRGSDAEGAVTFYWEGCQIQVTAHKIAVSEMG